MRTINKQTTPAVDSEYFDTEEDKMSNKLFCFDTEVTNRSKASFLLDKIKAKNEFASAAPNERFGEMAYVEIPQGYFAVATVPKEILNSEAWTEFYSKEIPAKGFIPDENYGIYFEFFDETGNYELWTAVTQQQ